ncbi:MAG: protein kinase [Pirellula sp.]
MSVCPKCKSSVKAGAVKCPKCGVSLVGKPLAGGTLNPEDLDSLLESNKVAEPSTNASQNASEVMDDSSQTHGTSLPSGDQSSDSTDKTDTLQSGDSEASNDPTTMQYGDSDVREVTGQPSDTGSERRLKRVWDAAIGSSGKDSKQSLRYERPEASDSIFTRVATRNVADANSEGAENADYQIQDKVGEGAMGIVYSAIQTAVNRTVAIKTIKADNAKDATSRRRFFYEAAITADLDHPNIPPIYELGASGEGIVFYSMKLISGSDWQKIMRSRSQAENLEVFNRVADAVAFAHTKNIIHRDLKPDNVIVGSYGEVYVTDWGLAIDITSKPLVPFGGTPDYMAPEMAADRRDRIGKHCDIYLLGAILFQIVTGKPPHAGRNQRERLNLALENTIVDPASNDPLLSVARTAMHTQPEDRYASVADLQAAIREILKHNDSIEMANRSTELARSAEDTKNYDTFNRAIFGFRGAIDLWDGNAFAKQGLQNARLAYGRCALDQGNFDLALQTLDEKNAREASLYSEAKRKKLVVMQREQRFKTLRRVFASVVALLLLLLSGASFFAYESQRSAAVAAKNETEALKIADSEKAGKLRAQDDLLKKQEEVISANDLAAKARIEADKEKAMADEAREKQRKSEQEKRDQKVLADQLIADARAMAAEDRQREAEAREKAAKLAAAQIDLAAQPQKFNLAISQIRQSDIQGATALLEQIKSSNLNSLGALIPNLNNWAAARISLLSNQDLPKQPLGGTVMAIDFAPGKNIGVAGNKAGEVSLLRFENGKLVEKAKKSIGSSVNAVIVSPDGSQAIIATEAKATTEQDANAKTYQLFGWDLASNAEPMRISETGNRSFQGFSYSPDGKTVLAGINQGLWARSGSGNWTRVSKEPQSDIRGELKDIGWISATQAIVLARLSNVNHIHSVDVSSGSTKLVSLPSDLADREVTALASIGKDRLLLGLSNGSLETYQIQGDTLIDRRELPKRHRSAIEKIRASGSGQFVSRSNEPVSHVWKMTANGDLAYETYLTSAPSESARGNNISNVAFVDSNTVVTVDASGSAVALNVERQKQRRQVTRRSTAGQALYPAPVVGMHSRGRSSNAIAVNEDGVVDLWNLQTGQTLQVGNRWSYFGHTPRAKIVDSHIDIEAGMIVTAASLTDAKRGYLPDPTHFHEYCFWDARTGNMLKRWTDKGTETALPRISMIEPGKILVFSDSSKIIDYLAVASGGELKFPPSNDVTGKRPEFSMTNPKNPGLVAMVNADGSLLLSDKVNEIHRETIGARGDIPMSGEWTSDGQRLYIVVNNGKIYRSKLNGNALERPKFIGSAKTGDTSLIASYHAIDLVIEDSNNQDIVYCAVRSRTQTALSTLAVTRDGQASDPKSELAQGLSWFDPSLKRLSSRFGKTAVNANQNEAILSALHVGGQIFITTKNEGVYSLGQDSSAIDLVGVSGFECSTADRAGNTVWSLRSDGVVLRLDVDEQGASSWQRLPFAFPNAHRLEASPDGRQFAVMEKDKLRLVSTTDGKTIQQFDSVAEFAWDPNADQGLGLVKNDGSIETLGVEKADTIDPVQLKGASVKSVHFFKERWKDDNVKPLRYLLVQLKSGDVPTQSESKADGELHFVLLDPPADVVNKERFIGKIPSDAELAVSPVDSVLATGDTTGTIRLWLASPTYDKLGELYDLESERDAPIKRIAFLDDGDTLVTSDEKSRLYGWLSKDKTNVR